MNPLHIVNVLGWGFFTGAITYVIGAGASAAMKDDGGKGIATDKIVTVAIVVGCAIAFIAL